MTYDLNEEIRDKESENNNYNTYNRLAAEGVTVIWAACS